ncbi:MAG: hypothetical protein EOP10_16400 [Proteobacteria bacterium]|nr:MAG: hypothetical protein EOP10_16400 [Pseudomonadota bacterium]
MERKIWPSALLALLCLVAALAVALVSPKDKRPGQSWAEFPLVGLKTLEFQSPGRLVTVEPLGANAAWITQKDNKGTQIFLGGERVRDLWFSLSPMWATKSLGKNRENKAADYGLSDASKIFRIGLNEGQTREFIIGARGFQSADYFVLDKAQGKVFLWNRETIDSFIDPARLALKTLSFLNPEGLNAIVLTQPGDVSRTRTLVKSAKLWSEGERPLASDARVIDWLHRFSKLTIKGYRSSPSNAVEPLLSATLQTETHWNLSLVYSAEDKVYRLQFGPGKPEILLDSGEVSLLMDEWATGKLK